MTNRTIRLRCYTKNSVYLKKIKVMTQKPNVLLLFSDEHNSNWVLFPEHKTIANQFSESGYATALIGKMHFGGRDQYHGFQERPCGDLHHGLGHQPDPNDSAANHPYATTQRENYGLTDITPEDATEARASYWGSVEFLDDCIDSLL